MLFIRNSLQIQQHMQVESKRIEKDIPLQILILKTGYINI